jgi:NAD(P)H-dependent flavin oxidoreductase YrpB (nitropropane dioxygenase family)
VNLLLAPPEKSDNSDIITVQRFLDKFRQELDIPTTTKVADATNKTPDIKIPQSTIPVLFEIILKENVPILSIGLGDRTKLVEQVHPSNIKVISMITTLEALHVVEGGVDIVVAQGLKQEAIAQRSS